MRISWKLLIGAFAAGVLVASCGYPPRGFDSSDPVERFRAAIDAEKNNDPRVIPELIKLLDTDDAVVRLGASRELERLTGQTMGYNHAAPDEDRQKAIQAWVAWYESGTRSVKSTPKPANPSTGSVDNESKGG